LRRKKVSTRTRTRSERHRTCLGDVEHEGSLGVAVADTNGRLVVHGTLVKGLDTVALSGGGRGEVDDNHLEEGVSGGEELPHDDLEEGLALEVKLIGGKLDVELLEHGLQVYQVVSKRSSSHSHGGSLRTRTFSFLQSMTAAKILKMGSRMNMLKARSSSVPSSAVDLVVHFLVLGLK
jgi:hypothetical protein